MLSALAPICGNAPLGTSRKRGPKPSSPEALRLPLLP